MSSGEADLESVTLALGGLEITVRRRARPAETAAPESDFGFELVTPEAGETTEATEEEVLAARLPQDLARLALPQLEALGRRLTGAGGEWSGPARVARAYRAGLGARRHLAGGHKIDSPALQGLRNVYYIVLRGPRNPEGLWTRSYQIYAAAVRAEGGPRGSFDRESSSHSFATLAEAEAYLLGAGRSWPPLRQ